MPHAQKEMDEAVADWLEAYQGHERYIDATERLFMAYARSWQGSPRYIAEGFIDFRKALLLNSGRKHLEVTKAFPNQRRERD